jgi:1,4-alpha-glucan branching enzyme
MVFEAAAETYIPLLWAIEEMAAEGIHANITLSLSPVVVEQLADDRFKGWFVDYLRHKEAMARQDLAEFERRGDGHLQYLAHHWQRHYAGLLDSFANRYDHDLTTPFRKAQEDGHIELMTCAATHGFLPLLHEDGSIRMQIRQAAQTYERFFWRRPRAIWLPECAYRPRCNWAPPPWITGPKTPWFRPGIEEFLGNEGFDYFIIDTHLLAGGDPRPVRVDQSNSLGKAWGRIHHAPDAHNHFMSKSPYLPFFVGTHFEDHPPVAVLTRDPNSSLQVWSSRQGYPGDYNYLDFHKQHMPGNFRYWRVTDDKEDLGSKAPYEPDWADGQVNSHAGHFLNIAKEILRHDAPHLGKRLPVLCAPFDAELFGHWWYEGPRWLTRALTWMNRDPDIEVMTGSDYLRTYSPDTAITLPEGSWGAGGHHWVWLNEKVDWTWRKVYDAELDMLALMKDHGPGHDEPMRAIVKQAARELLLLQASDWQFLITTGTAVDYASERLGAHHADYKRLSAMARRYARGEVIGQSEWDELGHIQERDRLFADIDPAWFIE